MPVHLHPTAALAERVLLPGDPGRALTLAQTLLDEPRMFNHNRGLWGYTGAAADGRQLTIQSTGMGGPSAAIVVSELAELGARRFVRIGTCGALNGGLELGEIVVAREAVAADGASQALGAGERVYPDHELLRSLTAVARAVTAVSTDLFYDGNREAAWRAAGAQVVEMETATVFTLASKLGLEAGALLLVTDIVLPTRQRIEQEALREGELRLGDVAARALA
jgi:uridine phosphorylase